MTYTVEDLLNQVQELIGEGPGDFYNIGSRLRDLNTAQEEMVAQSRALPAETTISIVAGTQAYDLPVDFLMFGRLEPQFVETANSNLRYTLEVIGERTAEELFPNWRDTTTTYRGTPEYLVEIKEQVYVFPVPNRAGTLTLPYIERPTDLAELDDVAFGGIEKLQRFAPGLAYYVANKIMLPRSPQYAMVLNEIYEGQLRKMTHSLRDNPQRRSFRKVVPITTWS
jgi:hypothetical protein